ncbi:hypothetical protein HPB50_014011 [Hyalomma asiaticum]|uniref:Uncharacterized protein n=1 Tax=Hyalomma asiaticum TaxID=266040 RepID=A0ACB7SEJ7_HYAAI|nr:hypothetical protein HPB50_014011 [Hyalomma asiaticum]
MAAFTQLLVVSNPQGRRKANFSRAEIDALVAGYKTYRSVIERRCAGVSKSRNEAWDLITQSLFAVSGVRRTTAEVRKKWADLKSLSKKGAEESSDTVNSIVDVKPDQLTQSQNMKEIIYTKVNPDSTSDDNLLKNVEMFDRLSLRFCSRVLFIKDVIGSNEICCWTFYGHGKKVAEVCCTSIVYATDKKHTKVEFPEARIYEETLNILLYENRNGPDPELMQATSTRGAVARATTCYTSDDEDERRAPVGSCSGCASARDSRESCHLGRIRSTKQSS